MRKIHHHVLHFKTKKAYLDWLRTGYQKHFIKHKVKPSIIIGGKLHKVKHIRKGK